MTENVNNGGVPTSKLGVIRALLAKAESTEHQPEADALRNKAFTLMAQYGVEQAMLNEFKPEATKEVPEIRLIEVLPGAYQKQRVDFLQSLMSAMGCKNVHYINPKKKRARRRSSWEVAQDKRREERAAELARAQGVEPKAKPRAKAEPPTSSQVECLGFPSDLDRAEMLWTSLVLQMYTMLLDDSAMWRMDRGEKRAFNNGRVVGFTYEVVKRVGARERLAKQQVVTDAPQGVSAELVLVSRASLVEKMWRERHDPASFSHRGSSFGRGHDDGETAGRRAGARANLGGTGLGRASQRALGQ